MKIVMKNVKDLKYAEYNPRKMDKTEKAKLRRSMEEFGVVEPVVVNMYKGRENVIIGGHQRIDIAKELKMWNVPCVETNLPPEKEKLLNLALNRVHGEWDEEKLTNVFKEIASFTSADYNAIELTGFDEQEIKNLLGESEFIDDKTYEICPTCKRRILKKSKIV